MRPPKYSQDCWGPFSNGQTDHSDLDPDRDRPSVRTGQIGGRENNSKAQERLGRKSRDKQPDELQQTAIKVSDGQKLQGFQVNIPWTPFSEAKVDRDLFERPYLTNTHSSAQVGKQTGRFADLSAIRNILPIHPETEPNDSCDSLMQEILAAEQRAQTDSRKLLGNFLNHFADNLALEQRCADSQAGLPDREKTDKKKPASSSQKQANEDDCRDRTMVACRSIKSSQGEQDCRSLEDRALTFGKSAHSQDNRSADLQQHAEPLDPRLTPNPVPVDFDFDFDPPLVTDQPGLHSSKQEPGPSQQTKKSKRPKTERALEPNPAQETAQEIKRINRLSKKSSTTRAETGTGASKPRVSQIPKYPAGPQLHQPGAILHKLHANQEKLQPAPREDSEDSRAGRKRMKQAAQRPVPSDPPMKDLLVRICRHSLTRLNN